MRIHRRALVLAGLSAAVVRAADAGLRSVDAGVPQRTFVMVPGAWHGAWAYRQTAALLEARGHRVFALTLTGVADKAALAGPKVCLSTHVHDVEALLEAENLTGVTLVGHSYGGMVVTVAGAHQAARLSELVYLDAFVPQSGQSMFDLSNPKFVASWQKKAALTPGGALVPPMLNAHAMGIDDPALARQVDAQLTPQPLATFDERVTFDATALERVPRRYIHCAKFSGFGPTAERVKKLGYRVIDVPAGHDVMLSAPALLVDALLA